MSEEYYRLKYLKYKSKYLELKKMEGGLSAPDTQKRSISYIKQFLDKISKAKLPYQPQSVTLTIDKTVHTATNILDEKFINNGTMILALNDRYSAAFIGASYTIDELLLLLLMLSNEWNSAKSKFKTKEEHDKYMVKDLSSNYEIGIDILNGLRKFKTTIVQNKQITQAAVDELKKIKLTK